MESRHSHLTDADLLLLADGELPDAAAAKARDHLSACWNCRERSQTLEQTIAGFVRARNEALDAAVPAANGPRALLRARMAQIAELQQRQPAFSWIPRRVTTASIALGVVALALGVFQLSVNAERPRPNARVTPGETRPISLAQVCSSRRAETVVRHISLETRKQVLAGYGLADVRPEEYEVDYLITPDLGGAETVRNLWPQPYSARWNASVKDDLEQRLHDLVCSGQLDLTTAQREIAHDWIGAYRKYVGPR